MLKERIEKAINDQINFELYSSYIYLSMSAYFSSKSLDGFANWMRIQTQEEAVHAMKLYDYVNERGGRVILTAIQGPDTEWDSPLAAFETVYKHETVVTGRICNIADIALEEKDHPTHNMIQWFVNEQIEEESNAQKIVERLKMIKDSSDGLFMLDNELGQRQFVMPAGATISGGATA